MSRGDEPGRRDQQVRGTYELGRRDQQVRGTYELGRLPADV